MAAAHLLSPFSLGALSLPNRVVLAPLTRGRAGPERIPNELMATYYVQRASAALLITEATVVSAQGNGWLHTPGIYTDAQTAGWRRVTDAVHAAGGRIFLQLWHCGRASHSDFHDGELPVAPSPIAIPEGDIHTPAGKKPYEVPRALGSEELPGLIADYAKAARRAKEAGFDGVEIHSANGYLLDQFLQSKTNRRTDAYGGSLEKRLRLLREVLEAVTGVWPADRVGVRLSPNGNYNGMGSPDYRATFLAAARLLEGFGLAYLHVVDGLGFGFHELGEAMTLDDFRKVFSGPLLGCCGYTQETAEAAIARGSADLIAFGRPYISNPDLVERFAAGAPLNPPADAATWFSPGPAGYTDYPALAAA